MSRFVSKAGIWHAAKEKVALINHSKETIEVGGQQVAPEEPYIYVGPDRAALLQIWQEHKGKQETLGEDFRHNTEFLQQVRNLGFSTVAKFLKFIGYDEEKVEKDFQEKAAKITKHELPEKVKRVEMLGGGKDFAGSGQDKFGGFGPAPDLPK